MRVQCPLTILELLNESFIRFHFFRYFQERESCELPLQFLSRYFLLLLEDSFVNKINMLIYANGLMPSYCQLILVVIISEFWLLSADFFRFSKQTVFYIV